MTRLVNKPSDFADEALAGFVAANPDYVAQVHGGVVRSTESPEGQAAIVVGGGTGHYPAFAGWVGPGFAHGAPCGNIFSSPSASQVYSVAKASHSGGGVLLGFGNYAGDVLHFGSAAEQLRGEGIDARILPVTDDIASGPADKRESRRGIAGDLPVFKLAGAAAEAGLTLDDVERVALKANAATDSLGVAFSGCTLPGADGPLFTVPEGKMALGLGIHGEPGISEHDLGTADEVAELLTEKLLADRSSAPSQRIAVILNGLGSVKYEELFATYAAVSSRLVAAGFDIVSPVVGEQVTSLDMAGLSLTITYLDDELEGYWTAPADSPAFKTGSLEKRPRRTGTIDSDRRDDVTAGSAESQAAAADLLRVLEVTEQIILDNETRLGDIDAVAGDGDHGIGMSRGVTAAVEAAREAQRKKAGAQTLLSHAADGWAERAGGTSGALWGAGLNALAREFGDEGAATKSAVVGGVKAFADTLQRVGGAQLGDKTMIDAVRPFAETLEAEASASGLTDAWRSAAAAAVTAAENTADIAAKLGRAKTHGDKSLGTPDAGAVSFGLIVTAIAENWTTIKETK